MAIRQEQGTPGQLCMWRRQIASNFVILQPLRPGMGMRNAKVQSPKFFPRLHFFTHWQICRCQTPSLPAFVFITHMVILL